MPYLAKMVWYGCIMRFIDINSNKNSMLKGYKS